MESEKPFYGNQVHYARENGCICIDYMGSDPECEFHSCGNCGECESCELKKPSSPKEQQPQQQQQQQ